MFDLPTDCEGLDQEQAEELMRNHKDNNKKINNPTND